MTNPTKSNGSGRRAAVVLAVLTEILSLEEPRRGHADQITGVSAQAWPRGRTNGNRPPLAVDGDTSTFTWTTSPFTTNGNSLGMDFGRLRNLHRIRLWKDNLGDWNGPRVAKDLVVQYTRDGGSMSSRRWRNVSDLRNGYRGREFLTASRVNPGGTVTGEFHNSFDSEQGWASLTFDPVEATGVRIAFSKTAGTSHPWVHYKVHEFQTYELERAFFVRGDADEDGKVDLTDALIILDLLFRGVPFRDDSIDAACEKRADVDDSGRLDITDAVYLLRFLFLQSPSPPSPFPACGADESDDTLWCEATSGCE